MGTSQRNQFTPTGNVQKIKLPWSQLEIPYPLPVDEEGNIDPAKLEANFAEIERRIHDNNRYLDRTDWGNMQGSRWGTIVIAANDSTPLNKQSADYVCSGSSDQTLINQVVTILQARASTTGVGRIVLLEGTYTVNGAIIINGLGARAIHIQGQGAGLAANSVGVTRINNLSGGSSCLNVAGPGAAGGSSVIVSDIHFACGSGGGIITRDMPTVVRDCLFTGASTAIQQTNSTGTSAESRFCRNVIDLSAGSGILSAVGPALDRPTYITENSISVTGAVTAIQCSNDVSTVPSYVVSDNFIMCGTTSVTAIDILGNSVENNAVTGNVVKGAGVGIQCAGYRNLVAGNILESCTVGISTGSDSQYLAILGNHITNGGTGVRLQNSAIRPSVVGNVGDVLATSYTVAAGVSNAFVGYNNWNGIAGTDAGTNTTITTDIPAGGAANYVLKKNSATSGDYSWAVDPAIAIAAAKGDLLIGLAAQSLGRLGVDRDGQFLITDSTQPGGIKWGPKLTISNAAPSNPRPGDIWMDTSP